MLLIFLDFRVFLEKKKKKHVFWKTTKSHKDKIAIFKPYNDNNSGYGEIGATEMYTDERTYKAYPLCLI